MKSALIVGGGVAGCAATHQLSRLGGWEVTLLEASPQLGAGVRTSYYGGHPHTFGPRHFLTLNEEVYDYFDKLCPLRSLAGHRFWTYVAGDSAFYDFPIHRDDVPRMPEAVQIKRELENLDHASSEPKNFEEYWLGRVGSILYGKFVDKYSRKMWMVDDNRALDTFDWSPKGVAIKTGARAAWDEVFSGYPAAPDGYDRFFAATTAEADVRLSTAPGAYDLPRRRVRVAGEWRTYDAIVLTVSPDVAFDFAYGPLHYVGREFHRLVLPVEFALPPDVFFAYYAGSEAFTRVTEFKKFTGHRSPHTLLGIEVPVRAGRHYPLPVKSEMAKAARYHAMAPAGVYFLGRHGSYRYGVDIAGAVAQAVELGKIVASGGSFGVVGERWRRI